MFLIPQFVKPLRNEGGLDLHQVWLFLERNGTHLLTVESSPGIPSFLEENEMVSKSGPWISSRHPDVSLVEIDSAATDLSSFYSWNEVKIEDPSPKECWRAFLWIKKTAETDVWGPNTMLEGISLGGGINVREVLEDILRHHA